MIRVKWIDGKETTFHYAIKAEPISPELIVLKDINDKPLKDSEIQDTVIHEVLHAVLDTLCFFDVSNNEPAVEWLTKCLVQLEKQGIFKI